MLRGNKKVVSDEVTKEDIDPVLLLWDAKNQTWYVNAKFLYHSFCNLFVDFPLQFRPCNLMSFNIR